LNEKYEKILHSPHHTSRTRVRMSESDRAAQFAPYAALSGFEDEVREEARITERRVILDECEIERLDGKLRILSDFPETEALITYFVNDSKKTGGSYLTRRGRVKSIDKDNGQIILTDGVVIPITCITDIVLP